MRWGNIILQPFNVKNGVQYPRICIYINDLIVRFRNLKVGCQLNCIYLGIWVYADEILLLSPSRSGLHLMTNVWEKFVCLHQLKL